MCRRNYRYFVDITTVGGNLDFVKTKGGITWIILSSGHS